MFLCVTTFKEVTFELRTEGGNRENPGIVWRSTFQMGNSRCQGPGRGACLSPKNSENYCGNGRCRPDIQGFVGHGKLLEFYSESNGSHRSLFYRGIIKSNVPHPIQAPTSAIPLLGGGKQVEYNSCTLEF